jgi:hypothetical protein
MLAAKETQNSQRKTTGRPHRASLESRAKVPSQAAYDSEKPLSAHTQKTAAKMSMPAIAKISHF